MKLSWRRDSSRLCAAAPYGQRRGGPAPGPQRGRRAAAIRRRVRGHRRRDELRAAGPARGRVRAADDRLTEPMAADGVPANAGGEGVSETMERDGHVLRARGRWVYAVGCCTSMR